VNPAGGGAPAAPTKTGPHRHPPRGGAPERRSTGFYRDSPLVLAQRELARVAALIERLLDEPDVTLPGEPASAPTGAHHEALRELVPRWHFAMLNDLSRNSLFEEAIKHAVRRGGHVLDIGSGSALLAMIAARYGADLVTSCEIVRPIAQAAARIVADNGLADAITVVNKSSDQLVVGGELPERADLIVTEIVDCGLVGEGILPSLRHARAHLLKPGGTIIPKGARVLAAPVDSAYLWQLNRVGYACGFDVSHFNEFASRRYFPILLHAWPYRLLTTPVEVLSFDFAKDPLAPGNKVVEVPIEESGTCHGIAFWFELFLDDKRVLTNEPNNRTGHWDQAFQCLPKPLAVRAGTTVQLSVAHFDYLIYFTPLARGQQ